MQTDLSPAAEPNRGPVEAYRLSPQQRAIWRLVEQELLPNAQVALRLTGPADAGALQAAAASVRDQHEILRTTFRRIPGMALPFQAVRGEAAAEWRRVDLRHLPGEAGEREAARITETERRSPFDLESGPVVRHMLVDLVADQHLLITTLPAVLMDRRSLANLARSIAALYAGQRRSDEEPLQYVQYAEWQEDLLEADDEHALAGRAFWSRQPANITPSLPFGERISAASRFELAVFTRELDPALVVAIERAAGRCGVAIPIFLEALWAALLCRLAGTSWLTIGHHSDGRSYPELENALGILSKTLPVTFRFEPSSPLWLLAREAGAAIREASGWEEYYSPGGNAADLPYRFEYEDGAGDSLPPGFAVAAIRAVPETFRVGLLCRRAAASISLEFQFDAGCCPEADINRLADYYEMLLGSAVRNPDAAAGALAILPESERRQVLVEFNETGREYPPVAAVHHLFEQQASRSPAAVAVVFEDASLTYAELNRQANQLAHLLIRRGAGPNVPVGLCLERSLDLVVALLAILKSGSAYVPLDPALPPERLAWMLEDSGAALLVTHSDLEPARHQNGNVVLLNQEREAIARESDANPQSGVTADRLVYVIYTSGSTGKPKGVAVEHRNLLNYVLGITERLKLKPGSSYASVSTIAADLGNTALFPALCSGGTLHLLAQERAMDPARWREYFTAHRVDYLKIVPSHLGALLGSGEDAAAARMLPRLGLILGGEASSWELVERVKSAAPSLRVFNHYGPTETTVGVLTYEVPDRTSMGVWVCGSVGEIGPAHPHTPTLPHSHTPTLPHSHTVPLGKPLPNSRVYLLNEQQEPVPLGVAGEVYIGGAGVARGYLNQPELTAQRFVQDPFSSDPTSRLYRTGDLARYLPQGGCPAGAIEFLGRIDHQVKIRGFRIELGEIESVLSQHAGVRDAVVLAREDTPGEKRLVGYVVSSNGASSPGDLREHLRAKLPEYMVPSAIVPLNGLPLTPNGKVDRGALPAPEAAADQYVAPRNPVEEALAGIWEAVLGRKPVGVEEDFFTIGGHSLLAMQVIARVHEVLDVQLPLKELFETPTVSGLAATIDRMQSASGEEDEELARLLAEVEQLSDHEAQAHLERSRV